MKKYFVICLALIISSTSFAQKENPLVGVWQQVVGGDQTTLTIGPNGKVFMPDGRVFGYFLNPTEFDKYEDFNFGPWMFATYEVTSDSTYTENVSLHNDKGWECLINFRYKFVNSRTIIAVYDHTYPDGSVRPIIDVWLKAIYDPKKQKEVIKKVADNWDEYVKKAKEMYGRE